MCFLTYDEHMFFNSIQDPHFFFFNKSSSNFIRDIFHFYKLIELEVVRLTQCKGKLLYTYIKKIK
jgi:hypothetical protein